MTKRRRTGTKPMEPVHHQRHPDISKHMPPEFYVDGADVRARDSDWLCGMLDAEMAQNVCDELNNTFEKVFRKAWRPNGKP